jgi:hypothetical protein
MKLLQSTEGIVNINSIFLYENGSKMAAQARRPLDEVILREVGLVQDTAEIPDDFAKQF